MLKKLTNSRYGKYPRRDSKAAHSSDLDLLFFSPLALSALLLKIFTPFLSRFTGTAVADSFPSSRQRHNKLPGVMRFHFLSNHALRKIFGTGAGFADFWRELYKPPI